jgi:hypothetical protein
MGAAEPVTVIETPSFLRDSKGLFDDDEREALVGYRVVYFYHSEAVPLFALNVFAKNEKTNLTKEERNDLKKLAAVLVENYRGKEKKK